MSISEVLINSDFNEIERMYPGVDLKSKYILLVQARLWFPYQCNIIEGNVELIEDGNVKCIDCKTRNPYPNKDVRLISMKDKKRLCDNGVPFIFDNFEELLKIKSVCIKWKIKCVNNEGKEEYIYTHIVFDLNIKYIENKNIYCLVTQDSILESFDYEDDYIEYLDKFEKIITIFRANGENKFKIKYIKGIDESENNSNDINNLIGEEFVNITKSIISSDYGDIIENDNKTKIYSYYKNVNIEPSIL